jgi:hypothetical protein
MRAGLHDDTLDDPHLRPHRSVCRPARQHLAVRDPGQCRGDLGRHALRQCHGAPVSRTTRRHVVKTLGDGLMAVFDEPRSRRAGAVQMHEVLEAMVLRGSERGASSGLRAPAPAGGPGPRRSRGDGRRLLRRRRQRGRKAARPRRRQRNPGHRGGAARPAAGPAARAFAAWTGWCCAAAPSRCRCMCWAAPRRGRPAVTQFGDVAISGEPDGLRLMWNEPPRVRQPQMPVVLGAARRPRSASTTRACRARTPGSTGTAAASSSPTSATTAPTCASTTARSSACGAAVARCTAAAPSAWAVAGDPRRGLRALRGRYTSATPSRLR